MTVTHCLIITPKITLYTSFMERAKVFQICESQMEKLVNLYNISITCILFLWWSFYCRRMCLYKGKAVKHSYLSNFDKETNCHVNVKPGEYMPPTIQTNCLLVDLTDGLGELSTTSLPTNHFFNGVTMHSYLLGPWPGGGKANSRLWFKHLMPCMVEIGEWWKGLGFFNQELLSVFDELIVGLSLFSCRYCGKLCTFWCVIGQGL